MKGNIIDARGRGCPEPVLMTKKGIQLNPNGVNVLVDSIIAKENITRFANNNGYKVEVKEGEEGILLSIGK